MAISMVKPIATSRFFCFDNGSGMNTLENSIQWTSTTNNTVTISWSIDGGSNWTVIDAGVASSNSGTNSHSWSLDATEYANILNGAVEVDVLQIKVVDDSTAANDISVAFKLGEVPFNNIHPNHDANDDPIYYKAETEIVWENSYNALVDNVAIDYIVKGGDWGSAKNIVISTPNTGRFLWAGGWNYFDSITNLNNILIRITAIEPIPAIGFANCIAYSEVTDDTAVYGFSVTDDPELASNSHHQYQKFPERKMMYSRFAIEKAQMVDEAIALGQLEAGAGVIITQREMSETGKLAGNIIFSFDPNDSRVRPIPREMQGLLDFTTSGNPAATAKLGGDNYGSGYFIPINHGWSLESNSWLDPLGNNIYQYQNKNSYMVEITQISAEGVPSILNNIICQHEAHDEDTIYVYCTVKGLEHDKTSNDDADNLVTLSKDRLGISRGTYKFEYRLKEVIPV